MAGSSGTRRAFCGEAREAPVDHSAAPGQARAAPVEYSAAPGQARAAISSHGISSQAGSSSESPREHPNARNPKQPL
jgi:hypothetical protein